MLVNSTTLYPQSLVCPLVSCCFVWDWNRYFKSPIKSARSSVSKVCLFFLDSSISIIFECVTVLNKITCMVTFFEVNFLKQMIKVTEQKQKENSICGFLRLLSLNTFPLASHLSFIPISKTRKQRLQHVKGFEFWSQVCFIVKLPSSVPSYAIAFHRMPSVSGLNLRRQVGKPNPEDQADHQRQG